MELTLTTVSPGGVGVELTLTMVSTRGVGVELTLTTVSPGGVGVELGPGEAEPPGDIRPGSRHTEIKRHFIWSKLIIQDLD